jgi:hypothetical protein
VSDDGDDRKALHARNAALEAALADKQRELDALRGAAAEPPLRPAHARGSDARDEAIATLIRRAWWAVAAFATTLAGSFGASTASRAGGAPLHTSSIALLLVLTAISAAVAVFAAGQPMRRRTGFDVDFMVSRAWLPGLLGLVMPPVALVDAFLRLGSRTVGGYQTTRENGIGGNVYPEVALPMGEGRPLGATLLLIATAWPALVIYLLRDKLFGA